jgi:hypothetical protein
MSGASPVGLLALLDAMEREVAVLVANGADAQAKTKRQDALAIERAEPDAVRWLNESEAMIRSGWPLTKVRRHAAMYRHTGHAIKHRQGWRMLAVIIPQRVPLPVLDNAARREVVG